MDLIRSRAILAAVPISERSLHLALTLGHDCRVLCCCGQIVPLSALLWADVDLRAEHIHSVTIDDVFIEGERVCQCYMHRDDVFNYNRCRGMVAAQHCN
jgi:hypothetical protein